MPLPRASCLTVQGGIGSPGIPLDCPLQDLPELGLGGGLLLQENPTQDLSAAI